MATRVGRILTAMAPAPRTRLPVESWTVRSDVPAPTLLRIAWRSLSKEHLVKLLSESLTPSQVAILTEMPALKSQDHPVQVAEKPGPGSRGSFWSGRTLQKLSGYEFERLIARLYEARGYHVVPLGGRSDAGRDLFVNRIAGAKVERLIVQAKRYRASISPRFVRELRGTVRSNNGERGILITNSSYSKEARREATEADPPIELVDGDQLLVMLRESHLSTT
jgi:HJR/Mrr/RecB family endonuclease